MSISTPWLALIPRRAFAMTVSVRRPRKSIFSSPSSAMSGPAYCVMIASCLVSRLTGVWKCSGSRQITTPAACTPSPRTMFSKAMAASRIRVVSPPASYSPRSSALALSELSMAAFGSSRIIFEILSGML